MFFSILLGQTASMPDTVAFSGGNVSIPVAITDVVELSALDLTVQYDETILTVISTSFENTQLDGMHFIIATPDFDSACARKFKNEFRMLHDKGHISLFTTYSLIKLLEDKEFEIIKIDYPFFETRWFTEENLMRMFDTSKVSPPFYGSHVVVFCRNIKK